MVLPLLVKACHDMSIAAGSPEECWAPHQCKRLGMMAILHLQHSKSLTRHLSITASGASILCLNTRFLCQDKLQQAN